LKRYVIDSYAMMAFFEDEPGAGKVAEILNELVNKKSKAYMSIINWGEIYYNTFRVQGKEMAETVLSQVERYPIELVEADRALTHKAAIFKGRFKIAYADCFAAALANRINAKVVTGDQEFRKLEKEIEIEWII
jgi:predicted nucleic acid-binding protein